MIKKTDKNSNFGKKEHHPLIKQNQNLTRYQFSFEQKASETRV